MKTIRKVLVELVLIPKDQYLPERPEQGKLYYAPHLNASIHLCLCGCGHPVYLPIKPGEWQITITDNKATVTPSIQQRFDCSSHYIITNGVANFV